MADAASIKSGLLSAYRDFQVEGVPASGANEPEKPAIRAGLGGLVDFVSDVAASVVSVVRGYALIADLPTLGSGDVGTLAKVEEDGGVRRWTGTAWEAFDDPSLTARDETLEAAAVATNVVAALPEPLDDDEFALSSFETATIGENNRVASGVDRRVELAPDEYALARFTEARVDDRFHVLSGTDRLEKSVVAPVIFQQSDGSKTQIWSADPVTGATIRLSSTESNETLICVQDGSAYWKSDRAGGAPSGYCSPVDRADERPVTPIRAIAAYGDSMTAEGDGDSVVEQLGALLGVPAYNFGISSNTSKAVAARQGGARSFYVPIGGVIPSSGSADLSPSTDEGPLENFAEGAASIGGSLAGIAGSLTWNGTKVSFARTSPGTALAVVAAAPFIVSDATTGGGAPGVSVPKAAEMIQMFWMGRNDIDRGDYDLSLIVTRAQSMADFLRPRVRRFIVMPVFNASTEGGGTEGYRRVLEVSALLRAAFPQQFAQINGVDARSYIVSLGAAGDAADQAAYAADKLPPSLLRDGLHLNAAGRTALAGFLRDFITLKGWL